ncbi:MAG: efflux RND transporter periplasmic adaptor subunit [Thermoguttaceae bacterium]
MSTTTCPSHDELHAYSIGLLSDEASDAVAAHLASCADCRSGLSTLDGAEDTFLSQLRRPAVADPYLEESQCQVAIARACAIPGSSPGSRSNRPFCATTLGEYQLIEELGQGGMGTVYKALHTKLDRVVALKVLSRGRVEDRQAISRFEREMKAVGKISHPNVVQAYDAREIDGMPVLIMEFVDGLDLAEIVRRSGPLPIAEACELVRRTALALECAREHGLVHRDVKPSNIMLTAAGEVKLLDLGLARFYVQGGEGVLPVPAGEETTGSGLAMGTADYMAPEQASDCHSVDIRADLYSLGCTLYKLLSGRAPFGGRQHAGALEKMNAHVHQPVPPVRDLTPAVPEELAAILNRMLAKDPGDRFATPADVAAVLEPFCKGANLADLAARASAAAIRESSSMPSHIDESRANAGGICASPEPRRVSRWPFVRTLLIALGFLGALAAGFAAGVMIMINKNGEKYRVEVPKDSHTIVEENGNATVNIAAKPEQNQTLVVNPTTELEMLQGPWNIVRVENGDATDRLWGKDFLTVGRRFHFDGVDLKIPNIGHGWFAMYACSVGSNAFPRWIDLHQSKDNGGTLFALGVYEIKGDQLKLCLAKCESSRGATQRPKSLAVEPLSGNVLLTLERYRPSADETDIQGHWSVTTRIEDGETISRDTNLGQYTFLEYTAFFYGPKGTKGWGYVLDPGKRPKTITMHASGYGGEDAKPQEVLGIYKFENGQLVIAYREDGSRPDNFESTRGSHVAMLVLDSIGPVSSRRRAMVATRPAMSTPVGTLATVGTAGTSAPAAPPEVTVVHPIVRHVTDHQDFTGQIEAAQAAAIWARVSGRLAKVLFKAGAMVKQGELLFEIDPAPFQAELDKREADVRLAQLRLNRTMAELKGAKAPPPIDRLRMEAQQAEAEAALTAAQEGLNVAKLNLASTRLTAPIGGKIGRPLVPVGSLVTDKMPLAAINSVDPMCVAFNVDEQTILKLRRSPSRRDGESWLPVLVQLSDEKGFPHASKVESADTPIEGEARWRALLPNPDGLLLPGMVVRVHFVTSGPYQALLVPSSGTFIYRRQQQFVAIVTDHNVVQDRAIRIGGLEDDGMTVVKEGLTADDWVIEKNGAQWKEGMTVKPLKTPAAVSPSSDGRSLGVR